MAVVIKSVTKGGRCDKAGVLPGESLLTINGEEIADVLDYRFHQLNRNLTLEIRSDCGTVRKLEIKKGEYEELGLEFETYLMDKQHSCRNKCIFCFIDQLPKGMRQSLYFKDDDSRLSFLFGNYVTLTNISEHEVDRIIKMHISPINVSVHTTNPKLRCKMLNNRFAGKALSILKRFADGGIMINCQIVSCPGINDGEELDRTLDDLEKLFPQVESIAVVPVGLTGHREGLYPLESYTRETALTTLLQIESRGDKFLEKYGRRIVFASDEFYLRAQKPLQNADFYEGFMQLEDGVGMLSCLKDEFDWALEQAEPSDIKRKITLACGKAPEAFLRSLFAGIKDKFPNITVEVVGIENKFFGGEIDVTGLVTGGDLISRLKGRALGEKLIISSSMLRREGDLFLDDTSTDDVEKELDIKLEAVPNDGQRLLAALLQ
ncbi:MULTISPECIES: DUF512 domain-containing protein [unclassified Ruminococcus]|uniref:DUF512 domain-containing protein n=1 Tax=unclassified Ruminococcus TaxID=2608920 RepID=UPI00210E26A7|nr:MULTISPECIES: DUF512 domain-containing protein [unclassified Ruminococcus]MCQ4021785.1 DUF512 domain-containing protein [Ruminococcus sp. zg-924]MCQ4114229.1 DUF512 domain-containing protein [Ruminococcus sp. zg-921]